MTRRAAVIVVAVATYATASLVWIAADRRHERWPPGSALETGREGVSLARDYLEKRGRETSLLTREASRSELPDDAVLLRLRPWSDGHVALLTSSEDAWVRAGGRLVLGVAEDAPGLAVGAATRRDPRRVAPDWPGVTHLMPERPRIFERWPDERGYSVFVLGDAPMISRLVLGRGDVVLCAAPEIFDNAHLGLGDHLVLLESLAVPGRPVYFDEFAHGLASQADLLEILGELGFGPSLALLALAGSMVFWRRNVRLGPTDPDDAPTGADATDLVDSLGSLYDSALSPGEALALYDRALSRAVAASTGLSGPALEARVATLRASASGSAGPRGRIEPAFADRLASLNEAFRRIHDHRR